VSVYRALPRRQIREFTQYAHPVPGPNDGALYDTGRTHICFRVDDIEAAYAELTARGVVFNGRPVHIDSGPLIGCAFAYFHDPDGVLLEILEDHRANTRSRVSP
jgi:catechol 2,3-dioxygenase-like lactoylglutathione lyase family enzyme